jgi:hypothetical protein
MSQYEPACKNSRNWLAVAFVHEVSIGPTPQAGPALAIAANQAATARRRLANSMAEGQRFLFAG